MANSAEYVTFLDSAGNEISNDPRWHAKNQLAQGGVDVDGLDKENAELRRQLAELQAQQARQAEEELAEDEDPQIEVDADGNRTYGELKSKALSDLLKERGIELEGRKTVGAAREALIAADKADAEKA